MTNPQLQAFLKQWPFNTEEQYNISVIFRAMKIERQVEILSNWKKYETKLLQEKQKIIQQKESEIVDILAQATDLLENTLQKKTQKSLQKNKTQKHIRQQLESSVACEQIDKQQKIKNIL